MDCDDMEVAYADQAINLFVFHTLPSHDSNLPLSSTNFDPLVWKSLPALWTFTSLEIPDTVAMPLAASIVLPACLSRLGQIKANVAFASAYVALQITHWWADRLEHCRPIKESSSICKTTLVGAVFLGFKELKKASVD
ncbi:hypothetical protein PSHT_02259 [Puccinia striiformis]|uniref:Uncharacterized protein n=1 Tax=Puccinia striiformis TaxID=27350 RepID=A0A2S4WIG5_9BASI|nr:hypothetical protein PSHT_02259 [Puccinia striiformis]